MVEWHHNSMDMSQAPGVGGGQGGLACCGPWVTELTRLSDRKITYGDPPLLLLKLNVPPLYQSLGFHCREVVLPTSINLCPTRA